MAELWDIYDRDRKKTGKIIQRGQPMGEDEYHIVVVAWIKNQQDQWLITKRAACKSCPLCWEAPGGAVLSGESSDQGVLREILEETGILLSNGKLFGTFRRDKVSWENPGFLDVWYFEADFDIRDVVLQANETIDCKWASPAEICEMIENGQFVPMKEYPYYLELFDAYASC